MIIDETDIIEERDEMRALACLLVSEVLFLNNANISRLDKPSYTVCAYVNCSDVFAWGCTDGESLIFNDGEEGSEIIELYRLWKEDNRYGDVKWVCIKRNEQPQSPLKKMMIEEGCWNELLESLPENNYDKAWKNTK